MSGEYIGKSQNGCLPNITGRFVGGDVRTNIDGQPQYCDGAFTETQTPAGWAGGGNRFSQVSFDASRSSSIYGNGWFSGTKVIPAGIGVSYIIKY